MIASTAMSRVISIPAGPERGEPSGRCAHCGLSGLSAAASASSADAAREAGR
jgi:hypothetical protein